MCKCSTQCTAILILWCNSKRHFYHSMCHITACLIKCLEVRKTTFPLPVLKWRLKLICIHTVSVWIVQFFQTLLLARPVYLVLLINLLYLLFVNHVPMYRSLLIKSYTHENSCIVSLLSKCLLFIILCRDSNLSALMAVAQRLCHQYRARAVWSSVQPVKALTPIGWATLHFHVDTPDINNRIVHIYSRTCPLCKSRVWKVMHEYKITSALVFDFKSITGSSLSIKSYPFIPLKHCLNSFGCENERSSGI